MAENGWLRGLIGQWTANEQLYVVETLGNSPRSSLNSHEHGSEIKCHCSVSPSDTNPATCPSGSGGHSAQMTSYSDSGYQDSSVSYYSNQNVVRSEPRGSLSRSPRAEGQASAQVGLTSMLSIMRAWWKNVQIKVCVTIAVVLLWILIPIHSVMSAGNYCDEEHEALKPSLRLGAHCERQLLNTAWFREGSTDEMRRQSSTSHTLDRCCI